jgi:hypothetical protein
MLMSTVNANDGRKTALTRSIVSYEDSAKLEALEDAIATAQLKQAMVEHTGFVTAVELLAMRSILQKDAIANDG